MTKRSRTLHYSDETVHAARNRTCTAGLVTFTLEVSICEVKLDKSCYIDFTSSQAPGLECIVQILLDLWLDKILKCHTCIANHVKNIVYI
jgi:hypothetical protein